MDGVEDPSTPEKAVEGVKVNQVGTESTSPSVDPNVCHKPNGVAVAESALENSHANSHTDLSVSESSKLEAPSVEILNDVSTTQLTEGPTADTEVIAQVVNVEVVTTQPALIPDAGVEHLDVSVESTEISLTDNSIPIEEIQIPVETNSHEVANDKVAFQTEVVVEEHVVDDNDTMVETKLDETQGIMSELGENIELSEALHSSQVSGNLENNNSTTKHEVFNKEELLDILEGNDVESPDEQVVERLLKPDDDNLEAKMAFEQLGMLKLTKKKKSPRRKFEKKTLQINSNQQTVKVSGHGNDKKEEKLVPKLKEKNALAGDKSSIVDVLVKDWDDEDAEGNQPNQALDTTKDPPDSSNQPVASEDSLKNKETSENQTPKATSEENLNNSGDHPQRRLGRVIKKKVIFDPDNPDTFTKSKSVGKNKETPDTPVSKDQPLTKKIKTEPISRAKSKSPISKLQWKKPPPKSNSKTNRRLTEVDRLLMDEGAVNMIYQLTPEAPKGRNNMKTKAEFIKKIQSSTPETKEMKFRERKRESKERDEAEPKKIATGKSRTSLSSSVKSTVGDDFETHSADDSIIYRRHSSSSYSSTCMSPRRLSDVEGSLSHTTVQANTVGPDGDSLPSKKASNMQSKDVFMADASSDVINKRDCLSIKEKLNNKLSLVLNKRKHENSSKTEKPPKQKRSIKKNESDPPSGINEKGDSFQFLSISFDQRLAEICIIGKTGSKCNVEALREIERALLYVDSKNEISVTLLSSECGALCSELELTPLLDSNPEKRTNYAYELAESIRSLLCAVRRHSKLLCTSARGPCRGAGLSVLCLSDVALVAEGATFALGQPPLPVSPLASVCPPALVRELVTFGRSLSAAEAVRGGLAARALWPPAARPARELARALAHEPPQSVLLKKKLLNLTKSGDSEKTFLACLETERDLLVEYWTSVEGQEVIRSRVDSA